MKTTQTQTGRNALVERLTEFLGHRPVIYQFLRFACIGLMNTALNFIILNALSKALGISEGWRLGAVDLLSFSLAVVQSYLWNRTWTFGGEQGVSLAKNFIRLVLVGLLGGISMGFVLTGAHYSAISEYYFVILASYFAVETVLWRKFGFHLSDWNHERHSFAVFAVVTFIGLGINVTLVAVLSSFLHVTHTDLDKNIATVLATCVSLFWNFIGYKAVVFRK